MTPVAGEVDVEGGALAYHEVGPRDGEVVLCLHGFPDTPGTWAPVSDLLVERGFRVVLPYLRGYAPSTLRGPFDHDRTGADVIALAEALSPKGAPVVVVGHDWGAVATYAACTQQPERFRCAVTLSVPHPATMATALARPRQLRRSWYMFFFQLGAIADRRLARDDFALVDRLWRDWSPGFAASPAHMSEVKRCLGASMPAPVEWYRTAARPSGGRARQIKELRGPAWRVRVPTLYLHGAADGCITPDAARGQARWFDSLTERVVDDAGHFLQLERPDIVAREIISFLGASPTTRS